MDEEKKAITFKVEDGKLKLSVDPNKDGQPMVELMVDIVEIPDEVVDLIAKSKLKKAE